VSVPRPDAGVGRPELSDRDSCCYETIR
jgi:hypothetical protein